MRHDGAVTSGGTTGSDRRPTSSDVARAAGVSRATVSFVLNDAPGQTIPAATREAVRRAAAELGYVPSVAARSLRSGRSRVVLCLATDWEPSVVMDATLSLLGRELRSAGYAVAVAKLPAGADEHDPLWSAISADAVVAMFDLPPPVRERLAAMRVPVVPMYLASRGGDGPGEQLQVSIGRLQVECLRDAGCTRIVQVVPGPPADPAVVRDRVAGVAQATRQLGLDGPEAITVALGEGLSDDAAARVFADAGGRLGICAYNDVVAMAILAAGRARGLAAPSDFRIVGVDDDPVAAFADPPLTTVRLNLTTLNAVVVDGVRRELGLAALPVRDEPFVRLVARSSA